MTVAIYYWPKFDSANTEMDHGRLLYTVLVHFTQWRIQHGAFGANAPPPPPCGGAMQPCF